LAYLTALAASSAEHTVGTTMPMAPASRILLICTGSLFGMRHIEMASVVPMAMNIWASIS
jgi:hypothetical protein